jgi:tetratricopeptide (TPR) repeat protein
MRIPQTEYILKGIYLGLLLYVALRAPDWQTVGLVAGCTLGGLALALVVAAVDKFRQGYRVQGRTLAFILFLLLESPGLVYAGILLGTAVGVLLGIRRPDDSTDWGLVYAAGGGAALGVVFGALRSVERREARLGLSLLLAAALVVGALALLGQFGDLGERFGQLELTPTSWTIFAVQLLIGIPIFYLLTFAGREEESEVEIGAMCAALGLGLWVLVKENPTLRPFQSAGFLLPVAIYFLYTMRIQPGLRVFKLVLRGLSYFRVGRFRLSLMSLRRALTLDPKNALAQRTLWDVHRSLDVNQLASDPKLLEVVDLDLCLDRAGALLLSKPTPPQLAEARRLLDLVLAQRPAMRPRVLYWQAVALTHGRHIDEAVGLLEELLDPSRWTPNDPQRTAVLLPAWQLAVTWHEELRRRVGMPQLALPGRRMEALVAVERHLTGEPNDQGVWALKRLLYQDVTEADYDNAAGAEGVVVPQFDHAYAQQLGLALINDPGRWQRGGEFLRLAARGMPATGPSIFLQIAQAHQRAGNQDGYRQNLELARRAGRSIGAKNLAEADRDAYFGVVKALGDDALARGDLDAAIDNFHLYTECERSGLPTLRTLADLYEKKGDPLRALRITEEALCVSSKSKEWLELKDRYYYSVMPEDIQARIELVRHCFDTGYCLKKARTLLDARDADLETINWAHHLLKVALVLQPESITGKLLLARSHLRLGERDQAVAVLESLRNPKPERFGGSDEEDAWYTGSRLLGELYLNELSRPDLAVPCLLDFKKSPKSGADTLYKLGVAYEQVGDVSRAKRCYEQVTAYEQHPLAPDARAALYRLQSS